jgi:hypothetical protein
VDLLACGIEIQRFFQHSYMYFKSFERLSVKGFLPTTKNEIMMTIRLYEHTNYVKILKIFKFPQKSSGHFRSLQVFLTSDIYNNNPPSFETDEDSLTATFKNLSRSSFYHKDTNTWEKEPPIKPPNIEPPKEEQTCVCF